MKSLKSFCIIAASLGLLTLGACSSSNQTTSSTSSPAASPSVAAAPASPASQPKTAMVESKNEAHAEGAKKGGQVIESGNYHLEFVPKNEANATHLDLYLLKGEAHETVPDAKVTAEIQLPDGSQKSVEMKYNSVDKHYTAKLPGTAAGEYKVAILTNIKGEKLNGRFSFTQ